MTDVRYNVIFEGRLIAGSDASTVKANLARAFKMDMARVETLFSGRPVVLKKDADQDTAMKFRAVLQKAGAECRLEPLGDVEEVTAAPPPAEPAVSTARNASSENAPDTPNAAPATRQAAPVTDETREDSGDKEMVGTIRTGGEGFSGQFDVAPVGADMAEEREAPAPIEPDISALSLAPPGEDLEELPRAQTIQVPDVSHLSVAPLDGKDDS